MRGGSTPQPPTIDTRSAFKELWTSDEPTFEGREFCSFSNLHFEREAGPEAAPAHLDGRREPNFLPGRWPFTGGTPRRTSRLAVETNFPGRKPATNTIEEVPLHTIKALIAAAIRRDRAAQVAGG